MDSCEHFWDMAGVCGKCGVVRGVERVELVRRVDAGVIGSLVGSGMERDSEAPWGRKADGTPRKRPVPHPEQLANLTPGGVRKVTPGEVPIPAQDTQLDDMRWAYHNPRAKPGTAGQKHQQDYLEREPTAFLALKAQLEMKAAAAGVAQYVGEQAKEVKVDEKTEELLAWGRAWLEELRGRKGAG